MADKEFLNRNQRAALGMIKNGHNPLFAIVQGLKRRGLAEHKDGQLQLTPAGEFAEYNGIIPPKGWYDVEPGPDTLNLRYGGK